VSAVARTDYELGLGLSAEHRDLADAVAGLADKTITAEAVRAALEAREAGEVPGFHADLVAHDLMGLAVPEPLGGAGGGMLAAAVALEALGRRAVPGPTIPTILAAAVLGAADTTADGLLGRLLGGTETAAVTLDQGLTATADGAGGWIVTGTIEAVPGGAQARSVIAPATTDTGETVWTVLAGDAVTCTEQDGLDLLRRAGRLVADQAPVPAARVLAVASARVRALASVVYGAEALGVLAWCTATASEYSRTRVQFGRPIGAFQAVKHACARMGVGLEQARAAVWDAAAALDSGDEGADRAGEVAAALVPELVVEAAESCIQVHGGIGFTWEHDAHLYYRRALAIRAALGPHTDRIERVAASALAAPLRGARIDLPDEADALRPPIAAELAEIAAIDDEDDRLAALGDGGWVLPHLPRPYGRGAGPLEQIVIAEQIDRAGIEMPQLLMGNWAVQAIVAHGTEEQKRDLVVPTLRGETVWCQLFSEPGAGSDLASLTTKAVKVDGGWQVTGQKIWTSVAQFAEWAMLIARTDPAAPKHDGITYFVLDMATPGITVRPLREMTGSALFNEVFLDEVFIPDAHVVGEVNRGWQVARTTLAGERVALSQKMEAYATDADLIEFATGRPLDPVARHRFGELIARSQAIDLIGSRAVLQQLAGTDASTTSSVGKLLAMGIGQSIAEFVVDQLGPAGVAAVPGQPSDKAIEQLLAGRATTIYGGTTEVQLNVIAERMLGLPRD